MAKKDNNAVAKPQDKKDNLLKIIIIVILSMILIVGGVLTGFIIGNKSEKADNSTVKKEARKVLKVYPLDTVTVNLADTTGKRYIKIKVSLGYEENSKLDEELKFNKDMVMDGVISIIRSKKSDEMEAANEKIVKDNIKSKINSLLINGQIEEVYFADILVQ
ncbi:flagellar FliL protein [Hathewaya proteolytica DSM 3090]|uniref:Flagellar protein FliL n=1 Tax=Hathewaya proteolytica DSM 3090 TaxID=1121331 RepID=A0A1M6L9V2_9CLOT|nr:flagellar basal body-associated FliL family protein [Hathewaya proteolytica]SHJ67944.1 flagellar FliL protein [Hathewaya proteolytica DSM 3090]